MPASLPSSKRRRGRPYKKIEVSAALRGEGRAYFDENHLIDTEGEIDFEALRRQADELRGIASPSRRLTLQRFALAYALWLSDNSMGYSLHILSGRSNRRRIQKPGPERYLEFFMSYPPGHLPSERRRRSRQISRDVRAFQHLAAHEVSPFDVMSLGQQRGQGLDCWARLAAQSSSRPHAPPTSTSTITRLVTVGTTLITVEVESKTAYEWFVEDAELARRAIELLSTFLDEHPSVTRKIVEL